MADKYDTNRLLHRLNDPNRILIFTIDEASILIFGFFIGMIFSNPFVMGLAIGLCVAIRTFKKRIGIGAYRAFAYWYLPYSKKAYKVLPPSYIREWLG